MRDRDGLPRADRRPPRGAPGGFRAVSRVSTGVATVGLWRPRLLRSRPDRPTSRWCPSWPPARRPRAASGSPWPAAWRWPAWPSDAGPASASAPAWRPCSRRSRSSGPARFGVPLTQAVSAPMLGRLEARGAGRWSPQVLACAVVRLLHNAATTAFFIWVITGGLDAYAGTYDAIGRARGPGGGHRRRPGADRGRPAGVGGLRQHRAGAGLPARAGRLGRGRRRRSRASGQSVSRTPGERARGSPRRFDPRAVTVAAAVAFALLLASTAWLLLAAVALWLALAWVAARPDGAAADRPGLRRHAGRRRADLLAGRRAGARYRAAPRRRAALLVLVATWLRGAAGAEGLREVSRRALGRLRRLPAAPEAAARARPDRLRGPHRRGGPTLAAR